MRWILIVLMVFWSGPLHADWFYVGRTLGGVFADDHPRCAEPLRFFDNSFGACGSPHFYIEWRTLGYVGWLREGRTEVLERLNRRDHPPAQMYQGLIVLPQLGWPLVPEVAFPVPGSRISFCHLGYASPRASDDWHPLFQNRFSRVIRPSRGFFFRGPTNREVLDFSEDRSRRVIRCITNGSLAFALDFFPYWGDDDVARAMAVSYVLRFRGRVAP